MSLTLVTAPAIEPVTVAELKAHLKIEDVVNDEDAEMADWIRSAREYGEQCTHRAFLTQTWDDARSHFPYDDDPIWLPLAPLLSVTSIKYVDPDGVTQTWNASLYTVDAPSGPTARRGCVVPNYAQYYPVIREGLRSVTIRFVAGYGATTATVPALIKTCLKEHGRSSWLRGDPDAAQKILTWVDRQLWPFKAF